MSFVLHLEDDEGQYATPVREMKWNKKGEVVKVKAKDPKFGTLEITPHDEDFIKLEQI